MCLKSTWKKIKWFPTNNTRTVDLASKPAPMINYSRNQTLIPNMKFSSPSSKAMDISLGIHLKNTNFAMKKVAFHFPRYPNTTNKWRTSLNPKTTIWKNITSISSKSSVECKKNKNTTRPKCITIRPPSMNWRSKRKFMISRWKKWKF